MPHYPNIPAPSSPGFTPTLNGELRLIVDQLSALQGEVSVVPKPSTSGLVSPLTTKGDIWGYSTGNARIPVGADGTVFTADSTNALGVSYKPVAGGVSGTGTAGVMAKWVSPTQIGNSSLLSETSTTLTNAGNEIIDGNETIAGTLMVDGFCGIGGSPVFPTVGEHLLVALTNPGDETRDYSSSVPITFTSTPPTYGGEGWDTKNVSAVTLSAPSGGIDYEGTLNGFSEIYLLRAGTGSPAWTIGNVPGEPGVVINRLVNLTQIDPGVSINSYWAGFMVGQPNNFPKYTQGATVFIGSFVLPSALSFPNTGSGYIWKVTAAPNIITLPPPLGTSAWGSLPAEPAWPGSATPGSTTVTTSGFTFLCYSAITTPLNSVSTGYGLRVYNLLDSAQTLNPANAWTLWSDNLDNFSRIGWPGASIIVPSNGNLSNLATSGILELDASNYVRTGAGVGFKVGGATANAGCAAGSYAIGSTFVLFPSSSLNYCDLSGALILENVSADPSTGTANCYLYSKSGQLFYREPNSGTVIGPLGPGGGGVSGTGTANTVPLWTSSTVLGNSDITNTVGTSLQFFVNKVTADHNGFLTAAGALLSSGYVNSASGYQVAGNPATAGHYLRGNGSYFVDSVLIAGDLTGACPSNVFGNGISTAAGISAGSFSILGAQLGVSVGGQAWISTAGGVNCSTYELNGSVMINSSGAMQLGGVALGPAGSINVSNGFYSPSGDVSVGNQISAGNQFICRGAGGQTFTFLDQTGRTITVTGGIITAFS